MSHKSNVGLSHSSITDKNVAGSVRHVSACSPELWIAMPVPSLFWATVQHQMPSIPSLDVDRASVSRLPRTSNTPSSVLRLHIFKPADTHCLNTTTNCNADNILPPKSERIITTTNHHRLNSSIKPFVNTSTSRSLFTPSKAKVYVAF